MTLDFKVLVSGEKKMIEIAESLSVDDFREATHRSIDHLLAIIEDLDDVDVVLNPVDEAANDPYATEGEEHIGWSIAHLIAHITASSEEGAAMSSQLARGIEVKLRNRYETPWRDIKTVAQCVQRLEESRRMRLAFLDTWPDKPHLDVYRKISSEFEERVGKLNAPASFLFGLSHEAGHYAQIEEVKRQALAAKVRA